MSDISVEIKKIKLNNIPLKDVTPLEARTIAREIEMKMKKLQDEKGVINTLNQALIVAFEYASIKYSKEQNEGAQKHDEEQRVNELIHRVKTALDM